MDKSSCPPIVLRTRYKKVSLLVVLSFGNRVDSHSHFGPTGRRPDLPTEVQDKSLEKITTLPPPMSLGPPFESTPVSPITTVDGDRSELKVTFLSR